MNVPVRTPVALIVFNRPETTRRVFDIIALAQPSKLLIVADGLRPSHPDDIHKCAEVREIVTGTEWECEILTNFADTNLGVRNRVSSGLDWIFEQVPEAIVLEDDCLPDATFFRFCDELLERYRDDARVMAITGDNFLFGKKRTPYSYYYSRYNHVWGWASWRRAWKYYDVNMQLWPSIRDGGWLRSVLADYWSIRYWRGIFERTYRGEIDTWDFQWTFACWIHSGLTLIPKENLVTNIGFGHDATHTSISSSASNLAAKPITFPLCHPPYTLRDSIADDFTQNTHFDTIPLLRKAMNKSALIYRAGIDRLIAGKR